MARMESHLRHVMGDLLQQLLDEVLEDAEKNDFDYLIGRAKELSAADGKDMEA